MFSELIQAYAKKQASLRAEADKAKARALAVTEEVANQLVNSVNEEVHAIFVTEKCIELEVRAIEATIQKFAGTSLQWMNTIRVFDDALKELGDVENWIKTVNYDVQVIAGALQVIVDEKG